MAATLALKRVGCTLDLAYMSKKLKTDVDQESYHSETESILSLQENETASPHDTSDTSNDVEYEVQTETDVSVSEISSGPEECGIVQSLLSDEFSTDFYVADSSDTLSSEEEDLTRTTDLLCLKCRGPCEYPFRLCLRCFRLKKTFLPPRPRGKRRKDDTTPKRALSFDIASSQESSMVSEVSTSQEQPSEETKNLCKCCFASPVDGIFIHRNSAHSIHCYKCSVKQWRVRGRCAICNQRCRVAKMFPTD